MTMLTNDEIMAIAQPKRPDTPPPTAPVTASIPKVNGQQPVATLNPGVHFQYDETLTSEQVLLFMKDILELRELNFNMGQGRKGFNFEPDFEFITKAMMAGVMRWVTARTADGRVVGLQQWTLMQHPWSKSLILAQCDSIFGGRKVGIDIKAFVDFGANVMRGLGAKQVLFCPTPESSFEGVLTGSGAKAVTLVMEV